MRRDTYFYNTLKDTMRVKFIESVILRRKKTVIVFGKVWEDFVDEVIHETYVEG